MADLDVQIHSKQIVSYDNPLFLVDGSLADYGKDNMKTVARGSISVTAMSSQSAAAAASWPGDHPPQVCCQVDDMSDDHLCDLSCLEA